MRSLRRAGFLGLSALFFAACAADAGSGAAGTGTPEDGGTPGEVDGGASGDDATAAADTCASCNLPHSTSACKDGACAVVTCESGFGDCDGKASNGCESSLTTADHCGTCAKKCAVPPNGSAACTNSACETSCNAGFVPCTQGCCLPPSAAPHLEAGDRVTCYVGVGGGVKCWGSNASGQLGVAATVTESLVPVDVTGLASGYDRVSAGHVFSCALSVTGGVKCWGAGSSGSLGNGLTAQSNTPVDVTGLTSGVAAIATGYSHACALTATGGVKCWGGASTYTTAVDVPGLTTGVVAIATGQSTGCAALTDGTVKCWGTTRPYAPAAVAGVAGAVAVTADYTHSCARLTGGGVKCWGGNGYGQLGATGSPTGPVDAAGLTSGVAEVTAGDWHTCAVTTTGVVKCWGWNAEGQLGPGSAATQSEVAIDVTGL